MFFFRKKSALEKRPKNRHHQSLAWTVIINMMSTNLSTRGGTAGAASHCFSGAPDS